MEGDRRWNSTAKAELLARTKCGATHDILGRERQGSAILDIKSSLCSRLGNVLGVSPTADELDAEGGVDGLRIVLGVKVLQVLEVCVLLEVSCNPEYVLNRNSRLSHSRELDRISLTSLLLGVYPTVL